MNGIIWRWDHLDDLTPEEADYWDRNALPMGWSIMIHPDRCFACCGIGLSGMFACTECQGTGRKARVTGKEG